MDACIQILIQFELLSTNANLKYKTPVVRTKFMFYIRNMCKKNELQIWDKVRCCITCCVCSVCMCMLNYVTDTYTLFKAYVPMLQYKKVVKTHNFNLLPQKEGPFYACMLSDFLKRSNFKRSNGLANVSAIFSLVGQHLRSTCPAQRSRV